MCKNSICFSISITLKTKTTVISKCRYCESLNTVKTNDLISERITIIINMIVSCICSGFTSTKNTKCYILIDDVCLCNLESRDNSISNSNRSCTYIISSLEFCLKRSCDFSSEVSFTILFSCFFTENKTEVILYSCSICKAISL